LDFLILREIKRIHLLEKTGLWSVLERDEGLGKAAGASGK